MWKMWPSRHYTGMPAVQIEWNAFRRQPSWRSFITQTSFFFMESSSTRTTLYEYTCNISCLTQSILYLDFTGDGVPPWRWSQRETQNKASTKVQPSSSLLLSARCWIWSQNSRHSTTCYCVLACAITPHGYFTPQTLCWRPGFHHPTGSPQLQHSGHTGDAVPLRKGVRAPWPGSQECSNFGQRHMQGEVKWWYYWGKVYRWLVVDWRLWHVTWIGGLSLLSFGWRNYPCQMDSTRGCFLQEVLHCQWCVEFWLRPLWDMESRWKTILKPYEQGSKQLTVVLQ